ncbi:MAG: SO_0444 family Cu/Zn efflux transporter [Pseudomonadota bacterium]
MELLLAFVSATLGLALDAAPWLLLGLVLAGLLKAFLPEAWMVRWVGGEGVGAVVRAALVGAPLPLCSCSVLPTALGLRRQGAGKGPTLAFMIATPETGVDSVAVTYALLGPVYAVLRPVGALISAVAVGLAVSRLGDAKTSSSSAPSACEAGCCGSGCSPPPLPAVESIPGFRPSGDASHPNAAGPSSPAYRPSVADIPLGFGCREPGGVVVEPIPGFTDPSDHDDVAQEGCGASCSGACVSSPASSSSVLARAREGVRYALTTLWDDLAPWLGVALLAAGTLAAFVPPQALAGLGQGLPGMLLMFVLGLPMYVCATAATPVAAALLAVGVGPGAVLVFLLAGPAANLGTLGVLRREFGGRLLAAYLVALAAVTLLLGLLTEWLVGVLGLNIIPVTGEAEAASPLAWGALAVLVLLALAGLARRGRGCRTASPDSLPEHR